MLLSHVPSVHRMQCDMYHMSHVPYMSHVPSSVGIRRFMCVTCTVCVLVNHAYTSTGPPLDEKPANELKTVRVLLPSMRGVS